MISEFSKQCLTMNMNANYSSGTYSKPSFGNYAKPFSIDNAKPPSST